jgi:uncharacterized protein (DUF58 family)
LALRRSDGFEFAELREYVDGDDPRRIDWAATARAGALQTRVFLEERALLLAVVLDASESMRVGRERTNYDLACEAAGVWYSAAADDDRCARIGADALILRGIAGRTGARACAAGREEPGQPLDAALRLALAALPRGTRLLVASDFYEIDALEGYLRACVRRFDVTALLLRDPWHGGLPLGGFVRLRDAETGRAARVFIDRAARERFVGAVAKREAALLERLRRIGVRAGPLAAEVPGEAAFARIFRL